MMKEPQAKVLGGGNVAVLNETVKVREQKSEQNNDHNSDEIRQHFEFALRPGVAGKPIFYLCPEVGVSFQVLNPIPSTLILPGVCNSPSALNLTPARISATFMLVSV